MDAEHTELKALITAQSEKIDALEQTLRMVQRYFLISVWVTVIAFMLPLLLLLFIIPIFLNRYLTTIQSLM